MLRIAHPPGKGARPFSPFASGSPPLAINCPPLFVRERQWTVGARPHYLSPLPQYPRVNCTSLSDHLPTEFAAGEFAERKSEGEKAPVADAIQLLPSAGVFTGGGSESERLQANPGTADHSAALAELSYETHRC
uniref:Uncharacterized protein n=1 Tax=Plectus sambesii TaxID=2011161 RepID=A0A914WWM9_9BILA